MHDPGADIQTICGRRLIAVATIGYSPRSRQNIENTRNIALFSMIAGWAWAIGPWCGVKLTGIGTAVHNARLRLQVRGE